MGSAIDLTGLFLFMLGILAGQQGQGGISFILFLLSLVTSGDKFTFILILGLRAAFYVIELTAGSVPDWLTWGVFVGVLLLILWRSNHAPAPGQTGPEHYAPQGY